MTDNYCPKCGRPNDNATVEIEVVLDRSGSMESIRNDAIGGYNAWLLGQQKLEGAANLTRTLFDNEFITVGPIALAQATPLTTASYVPRGATALNDAIGQALDRLEQKNPAKAILAILTDGFENASKKYNKEQIKTRIQSAQERGWQVLYLSASLEAFADAAQYGVWTVNTMQFSANAAGVRAAVNTLSESSTSYRSAPVQPDTTATENTKSS